MTPRVHCTHLSPKPNIQSPILDTPDVLESLDDVDTAREETAAPNLDRTLEAPAEHCSRMPKYPPNLSNTAASPLPRSRILALASGFVGIQFCWAVQVGYVTKALLELGLLARYVSYAWLAGPIAGLFMQPLVGILSDRCTSRLGRRRPFLIAGTAIAALCILLFAYAAQIGVLLGDQKEVEGVDEFVKKPRALMVAILAFWALDFAINAAQGPLRTLLADVVPTSQHRMGNAYFALATGLGNCFGSLMGSVSLTKWWPIFPGDLQALYTSAALVLLGFMAVTVVFVKEKPLERDGYERLEGGYGGVAPSQGVDRGGLGFFEAARVAPYPFFETFLVQCFSWFGWFTMFVFATSWVGKEVYNGQYDAPEGSELRGLYDAGVRAGNLGIGLQSVLTIVFSLLLPAILERFSAGIVYFISHLLMGTALCSALLLHRRGQAWMATTILASTGFSWAVTMTIPWSLMSEAVSKKAPERAGVYFTIFNLSQCLPEIVVSLISEEVERVTQSQAAVLGLGGMVVYIGGALIVLMGLGMKGGNEEETVVKYSVDG